MGQYYKAAAAKIGSDPTAPFTVDYSWYSHDLGDGLKLMEHAWSDGPMVAAVVNLLAAENHRLVWAGDYADLEPDGETLYNRCASRTDAPVKPVVRHRYLYNVTKQEWLDLAACPAFLADWSERPVVIHPLPLLTAEGNGRGGGDYFGTGMEFIGRWARDVIFVKEFEPKINSEIRPNFVEDGATFVLPLSGIDQFYNPELIKL